MPPDVLKAFVEHYQALAAQEPPGKEHNSLSSVECCLLHLHTMTLDLDQVGQASPVVSRAFVFCWPLPGVVNRLSNSVFAINCSVL